MNPTLATITPYWCRSEMFKVWWAALAGATIPGIRHLIFCVGPEKPPIWDNGVPAEVIYLPEDTPGNFSIGHYHNLGAKRAGTEWIMKLDVDCIPNVNYFRELIEVLKQARPREWFNGGMIYTNPAAATLFLSPDKMPLSEEAYLAFIANRRIYCGGSFHDPAATNFICRRWDYLDLGGCDERFRGYGWEDYQQVYALEKFQRGEDPLPGGLSLGNVTARCRDEISRPKAAALWRRSPWLCLLHRYHPPSSIPSYRSPPVMDQNKKILLERIQRCRRSVTTPTS